MANQPGCDKSAAGGSRRPAARAQWRLGKRTAEGGRGRAASRSPILTAHKRRRGRAALSPGRCPVCLDVLLDPVAPACGHAVCRACRDAALASGLASCPVCRRAAPSARPMPALERAVRRAADPHALAEREEQARTSCPLPSPYVPPAPTARTAPRPCPSLALTPTPDSTSTPS